MNLYSLFTAHSGRGHAYSLLDPRCALAAITGFAIAGCGVAASPDANSRLVGTAIDESRVVALAGNTHPRATADGDAGALDDGHVLSHMQLLLRRTPEQEAALTAHIAQLHDPASPLFHHWLTAEQFAASYGVSPADVEVVSSWLASHGFEVDHVAPSRMFIEFSGTARQVREAFHTEVHHLQIDGVAHFGNMSDPQIPEALASVVVGVHALHDFMPRPMVKSHGFARRDSATGSWSRAADPDFTVVDPTNGTFFAVAPADFATIYNLNPVFSAGIRGAGQTVVVIEDTNIKNVSDVTTFRSAFGLSGFAGTFSQVHPAGGTTCTNPGVNGDEGEAALDAEWAGAAAPDAAIELASCADTATVFGGLIAVQNLVNSASPPPVISISYGLCESENGSTANQSYVAAYQQAVAEGVSVFVSAGDEGAASCDANATVATHGIAVSGFASTPFNVAVGGTDFEDTFDNLEGGPALSTYWTQTNGAAFSSALSYIPEVPWNDSCASQLIDTVEGFTTASGANGFCNSTTGKASFRSTASGSGGPSAFSHQPAFQTGVTGLPTASGGPRYLPDVSLFAANGVWGHFYVFCFTDTAEGGAPACTFTNTTDVLDLAAGGTSFSAPALAGIQALINQKQGGAQGNPNAVYYRLAAAQQSAGTACNSSGGTAIAPVLPDAGCVFNDVTQGDIDVNCTGTNCFGTSRSGRTVLQGALSTSTTAFSSAYAAGTGWDFATGLGTVNAANLVNNW